MNKIRRILTYIPVVLIVMALRSPAYAQNTSFNNVASNIVDGISNIPGLISAVSYLMAIFFAVMGILKIKDHVEDPNSTKLKDGAIRLAAGGALFALPVIMNAMLDLIGAEGSAGPTQATLHSLDMGVN